MAYASPAGVIVYAPSETQTLANSSSITSSQLDLGIYDNYQVSVFSNEGGLTLTQLSRASSTGTQSSTSITMDSGTFVATFPRLQRYMTFTVTNSTGSSVDNVRIEVTAYVGSSLKATVAPLSVEPEVYFPAVLTKSELTGLAPDDTTYTRARVNEAGGLVSADFGTEIARGLYPAYSVHTAVGRNPDVSAATDPEDVWDGGGLYTGFDPIGNQNLETLSSNAQDAGSVLSSGTSTGVSGLTLTDSTADFVGDGVAVGDLLIDDTASIHGSITAVAATVLTVRSWNSDSAATVTPSIGDAYRVVEALGTGAAVVKWTNPMNASWAQTKGVYVVMNGTSGVTTTGSFYRLTHGRVVLAGSGGVNAGNITARQAVTTANVFAVIPSLGETSTGAFTVPSGKICVIKRLYASIVRASAGNGTATLALFVRNAGESFTAKRVYNASTASPVDIRLDGGLMVLPRSDVKWHVSAVSDDTTLVSVEIEYYLIDE